MKRAYTLAVVLSIALSCQIQDAGIREISSNDLYNYSAGVFTNYVVLPVETVELLVAFDEYLSLSDEEKQTDKRFYGHISQIYDTVYEIYDSTKKILTCRVDTQGKSLKEDSAEWVIAEVHADVRINYGMSGRYYGDCTLPEYTAVTMTDSEKKICTICYEGAFEFTAVMHYIGEGNGRASWEVTCTGKLPSSSGLTAMFDTGDNPLEVKERLTNGEYLGHSYKGNFNVDICNGDSTIDWCHMTMRPGFSIQYQTNR